MKLSAGTGQENFLIRWTLKHNHIFLHSLQISDILNAREIQLQQEIETVVWKLPSKVGLHWICSTIGGTRPPVNRSKYSTELQERKQAVPAPPYPSRAQVVVARQSTRGLITPADILIHDLWRHGVTCRVQLLQRETMIDRRQQLSRFCAVFSISTIDYRSFQLVHLRIHPDKRSVGVWQLSVSRRFWWTTKRTERREREKREERERIVVHEA